MNKKLITLIPLILFTNLTPKAQHKNIPVYTYSKQEVIQTYDEKILDVNYINSILSELKENKVKLNNLKNN